MTNTLLTLLLSLQLALPAQPCPHQTMAYHPGDEARPQKTWWGLIDPELALWFARTPEDREDSFRWDWSWQGFWSALFSQPLVKEDAHAPTV